MHGAPMGSLSQRVRKSLGLTSPYTFLQLSLSQQHVRICSVQTNSTLLVLLGIRLVIALLYGTAPAVCNRFTWRPAAPCNKEPVRQIYEEHLARLLQGAHHIQGPTSYAITSLRS